ncbi:MAG: glycosyltransferase family 2 protein [bacterium]
MTKKMISLIIPTFNEDGNILNVYKAIKQIVPSRYEAEIIFVDDGSTDDTIKIIKKCSINDDRIHYISFTRNFGQQYALKAGIDHAHGDAVITLDADLEHPPALIPTMIKEWEGKIDLVLTKRREDPNLPYYKRLSSRLFYRLINLLSDVHISENSPDFRLMDRKVVDMIKNSQESTLFFRGLVMWGGYSTKSITYDQHTRSWGKSKYNFAKMLRLAIDAITSFSILPLRLATILGFGMSMLTGIYGIYAIIAWFTNWHVITGWPSVIISVLFIGGLQLLILGIIGEYIGKIYLETKHRPQYLVKEKSL